MKEIKMMFQGHIQKFQITYECPAYIFCECREKPEARGFFTRKYIQTNSE
jgi:hypothetical protein